MLSILIPTYHRDMLPLVEVLRQQCINAAYPFEIIVFDDASESVWNSSNAAINDWEHCYFHSHETNLGRAANRNALAAAAKGTYFLFLDGDMLPHQTDFIARYKLVIPHHNIAFGGVTYSDDKPESDCLLRWIYGKKREEIPVKLRKKHPYATCLTSNLLIERQLFEKVQFNPIIATYGYEDLMFIKGIAQLGQPILHIDNPALHLGLEPTTVFLQKTNQALDNAKRMVQKGWISSHDIKALKWHKRLLKWGLKPLVEALLHWAYPYLLKNLYSKTPYIRCFDLYKLYYLLRN